MTCIYFLIVQNQTENINMTVGNGLLKEVWWCKLGVLPWCLGSFKDAKRQIRFYWDLPSKRLKQKYPNLRKQETQTLYTFKKYEFEKATYHQAIFFIIPWCRWWPFSDVSKGSWSKKNRLPKHTKKKKTHVLSPPVSLPKKG